MSAKRARKGVLRKLLLIAIIAGLFGTGAFVLWISTFSIPDISTLESRKVAQSTKIYDRTGEVLLFDLHENIKRSVIPYDAISRHVKNATVAIEDNEFYEHNGIKPTAFLRAVLVNLFALNFEQGGSTITQQVVKNILLTNEKLISRKLKEWVLAVKLEQKLSKDEILGLYLNEVPYGGTIYGIEEAAQAFFEKPASDIELAEAAYLAALPKAPTYYSPYGNHRDELEERKNTVLAEMYQNGFIEKDAYETAREKEVVFAEQKEQSIQAPHFVMYIREYLEEKYGRRAVEERGFEVTTTLDWEMQQKAQEVVKEYALQNKEKFDAENAGLIAIDPKTGGIRAMVGSRDYFDPDIDGNFNITLAHRQPGSSFKPFVYATALEEGYTPKTVLFDVETQFAAACDPDELGDKEGCYSPVNYDDRFRGPVTFKEALAQSINVPAVKALYLAGLSDSFKTAKDMGIEHLTNPGQYGLTLVLGGGEVSLLNMTSAYGVFANDGVRVAHTPIKKIVDGNGDVVEEQEQRGIRVLKEQVARQITDILSDNEARAPAFGYNSPLHFPGRDVAAKTGTTNNYRDMWIIGYTPNLAVGAWAGNNDNRPVNKEIAGLVIAPLWNAFMREILPDLPEEEFIAPKPLEEGDMKPVLRGIWLGGETYTIDTISGKLATEHTPKETRKEKIIPNVHSILYWLDKNNPRGPIPENPEEDSQFENWEYSVREWVERNGIEEAEPDIPDEVDDVHTPENKPSVAILAPDARSVSLLTQRVQVNVSASGAYPIKKTEFYIDGNFLGETNGTPIRFSFIPQDFGVVRGTHTLSVVVYDAVFNKSVDTVQIELN